MANSILVMSVHLVSSLLLSAYSILLTLFAYK